MARRWNLPSLGPAWKAPATGDPLADSIGVGRDWPARFGPKPAAWPWRLPWTSRPPWTSDRRRSAAARIWLAALRTRARGELRRFSPLPMPVALAVYEWSGRTTQSIILNWTMIRTQSDLLAAASTRAKFSPVRQRFRNCDGITRWPLVQRLMQEAPPCLFQTIDLSGDGSNNDGYGPRHQLIGTFRFRTSWSTGWSSMQPISKVSCI